MCRAIFRITSIAENTVTIEDIANEFGSRSVTNDAEQVVAWLNNMYPKHKILCIDTVGDLGELLHENGVFKGFGLC